MTNETPGTLEELLAAHEWYFTMATCSCGHFRTFTQQDYAAHLADVVRAWLAEQAVRDDVLAAVAHVTGNYRPPTRLDRTYAGHGIRAFLAALDRRPDGPETRVQAPLSDSGASDGPGEGHGDDGPSEPHQPIADHYCGQQQRHGAHVWTQTVYPDGDMYSHDYRRLELNRQCGGHQ